MANKTLSMQKLRQVLLFLDHGFSQRSITYIPMAKGFVYMVAFIDVYSRKIVGWGISNSMTKKWRLDVLHDAITQNGKPKIINLDQGAQFTSSAWIHYLEEQKIRISMDGKGRATDNTWIERFWKSLKQN